MTALTYYVYLRMLRSLYTDPVNRPLLASIRYLEIKVLAKTKTFTSHLIQVLPLPG